MKFFEYFRFVGTLSVLAWMGAATALAFSRLRPWQRWRWLRYALAAAVLAWMFGQANSESILNAKLDDREQIAKTLKENEEAREDAEKQIQAQYAEDAPGDALAAKDLSALRTETPAGKDGAPPETPLAAAADTNAAAAAGAPEQEPEYRSRGKEIRSEEAKVGRGDRVKVKIEDLTIRYMKADDLKAALLLNRLNRIVIRLMLLGSMGMIVWEYLRAFNATLTTSWLLPIGGRWLDAVSPKARTVMLPKDGGAPVTPEGYAEAALRRRENLIFFCLADPWPATGRLARLSLRSWLVWGIPKVVAGSPGVPSWAEFLLDGAWFGRYAVVVPAADSGRAVLAEMTELLWHRHVSGAFARRTVHIAWALPEPPDAETIDSLRRLARDANVRLAVWTGNGQSEEFREAFDEVH